MIRLGQMAYALSATYLVKGVTSKHGSRTSAILGGVDKLNTVIPMNNEDTAASSSRKVCASAIAAWEVHFAMTNLEVRAMAAKRWSLSSSILASAMSVWKKPRDRV